MFLTSPELTFFVASPPQAQDVILPPLRRAQ